ncbi:hypothetical protein GCM10008904_22910 [Paraclostridium ghonii]|uniref:DUF1450 domain-containing protein n=1 Tax=Paraclostridium ghonii TaxID=29358 RepID=A0ABU0N3N4_9FIRM|nr:hypothetical protein [Paeniclostridium ghonii]MDQ0557735.1 hypothetical protein [Paeniclostridium ghonii]
MISFCSMCSGIRENELKRVLLEVDIKEDCICECGSKFTAYVDTELITAKDKEDFISQTLKILNK